MEHSTGIIILAAGKSSRLGRPKQLLDYKGQSFIKRVANAATSDKNHAVVVVTGAQHEKVAEEIRELDVLIVDNENWESGMGSSIITGLKRLLLIYPEIAQCIICVCDQPFVNAGILDALKLEQQKSTKAIIGSSYADTLGVPALFTKAFFSEILSLKNSEGAKKLIEKHAEHVSFIPFDHGATDIDTLDDYEKLKQTL